MSLRDRLGEWAWHGGEWRRDFVDWAFAGSLRMRVRNGFRVPQGLGVSSTTGSHCRDCGAEPELYLVKDRLWRRLGMRTDDGLCLSCLAIRLGRGLRPRDFLYGFPDEQTS